MIDKIYIDFFDGTHGNFLRYLIYRFVLDDTGFKNKLPFTDIGTSHVRISAEIYKDRVQSFPSGFDIIMSPSVEDLIIRIVWDPEDAYLSLYNLIYRAGSGVDIDQRSSFLPYNASDRKQIRNKLYSQLREEDYYKLGHIFRNTNGAATHNFKFHSFFNFDALYWELTQVSKLLDARTHIDATELQVIFEQFIAKAHANSSKARIEHIFSILLKDENCDISDLLVIEEAYLNVLITKQFDIHGDLSIFNSEMYPTQLCIITEEIKQVLKNRNSNFDVCTPISDQWEQVRHLP